MHSLKTTHHLVQSLIILNSTSQRVSHRQFLSRPQATEEIFRWKMQILFCFHFAEVNEVKSVNYTKTPIKKSKDKFSVDNSKTFMIWKKKIKGWMLSWNNWKTKNSLMGVVTVSLFSCAWRKQWTTQQPRKILYMFQVVERICSEFSSISQWSILRKMICPVIQPQFLK